MRTDTTSRSTVTLMLGIIGVAALLASGPRSILAVPAAELSSPQPHITALSPDPLVGSNYKQWITIHGSGFARGFTVRLRAEGVNAHITDRERLKYLNAEAVQVQATLGTEAATWFAQVLHPNGGASNTYAFTPAAPRPHIESMSNVRKVEGESGFELTLYGTFTSYSVIRVNGRDRVTVPVLSDKDADAVTIGLRTTITETDITEAGEREVQVFTPPPGGGLSNAQSLFVVDRPFYQSPWFYWICMGGIAGGGFMLYRFRIKHLREKELQQQVEERTQRLRVAKEKTEAQAAQLEEQALRLAELDRVKSQFFANISHEFRTPLTLILGTLADLRVAVGDAVSAPVRDQLSAAEGSTQRLKQLIDQLLELSRLEAGQMQLNPACVEVEAFLEELVQVYMPLAERWRVALSVRMSTQPLRIDVDPEKLTTVLGNLIANALKFTPADGKVLVSVDRVDEADEHVVLRVRDTGIGIPEEELPYVFDRFHQVNSSTTREHEGAGIGLALAKDLVELHGGSIEVMSEVGFGTEFVIRLPRELAGHAAHTDSGAPAWPADKTLPMMSPAFDIDSGDGQAGEVPDVLPDESSDNERPLALVVEDNADVRRYLRRHLRTTYRVQEAANGHEALARIADEQPALVLTDIMMPVMDGLELCRAIKQDDDLKHIPVIVLTARAGEQDAVDGLAAGADDYVRKPFNMLELQTRIHNAINARQELRQRFSREVVMQPTGITVSSEEATFFEQARAVVEAHLGDEHFTVEMFAHELGMSKSTLTRWMKQVTGFTPAAFVQQLRLDHAGCLLARGAGTVSEVAYAVGYRSADHFSQLFRDHFGKLPSQYTADDTA